MDAPVGILTEEAGDAGMLCAPHHVQSIPARAARDNHGAKNISRRLRSTESITPRALTFPHAPLYSALRGFVGTPASAVSRVFAKKRTVKSGCATDNRNLVSALQSCLLRKKLPPAP